MANQHIEVPGSSASRLSGEFRALIEQLQRTVDHASRHKAIVDQVSTGSDWVALAAAWGVSVADAQAAYALLTTAQARLTGNAITDFLSRLG